MMCKYLYMNTKNNICKYSFKERRNEGLIQSGIECNGWLHGLTHGMQITNKSLIQCMSLCTKSFSQRMDICMDICSDCIRALIEYMTRLNMWNNSLYINLVLLHTCKETMYIWIQSSQLWFAGFDGMNGLKTCIEKQHISMYQKTTYKYVNI